ncbi:MAG: hypothetical protein WC043_02910 [Pseudobdellovibrionaceae bacterium]
MAQDYSDTSALKLAKETVGRLEAQYKGNSQGMMGELIKMRGNNSLSKVPTADEIFKQRVGELADAYMRVSDGKGGVARDLSKAERAAYDNVLEGKYPNGNGYLVSQRLALATGKEDMLASGVKVPTRRLESVAIEVGEEVSKKAGKFGIAGKFVGAAAGVTVAMASGHASASELTEAGLNGVSDGLGTLTVGEGSGRNRLCQVFGDVVVPGAAGVGAGLVTANPVVGVGAGIAASAALSEPATNACNSIAQKLGF